MLVEKIEAASYSNGLLRVQTARIGADGSNVVNDSIDIPGNLVGIIINGLAEVSKGISNKLEEGQSTIEEKPKKPSKKSKKEDK